MRQVLLIDDDRACRRLAQTGHALRELPLAVAGNAGNAHDLAAPDLQLHPPKHLGAAITQGVKPLDPEAHGAASKRLRIQRFDFASHHHPGQLVTRDAIGRSCADHAPVAQRRHAIADRHDFVQLVGDKHETVAFAHHALEGSEQIVDLLGREHGSRLVEDDKARAAIERLEDLHALLLADRQMRDGRRRVNLQPVCLRQRTKPGRYHVQIETGLARRLQPQRHVFRDGQLRHEHEVLVDHADAGADGLGRRTEYLLLSVDVYFAFVGPVETVQHPHQRALARAVLAEKCVYFSRCYVKRDVGVCHDAGETLGDAAHFHPADPALRSG